MQPNHHTYRVTWFREDQEYVATCAEFPSLSWLDGDEVEALRGIRRLVAETVEDMRANGEPVPEPSREAGIRGDFSSAPPRTNTGV